MRSVENVAPTGLDSAHAGLLAQVPRREEQSHRAQRCDAPSHRVNIYGGPGWQALSPEESSLVLPE